MTDREVSQLVKDLIEVHGVFISTNSNGVFIPATFEEKLEGLINICKRASSLYRRAKEQKKIMEREYNREIYLPLFEEEDHAPQTCKTE